MKYTKHIVIIIVTLAVGFFAGMEYKAYQIRSAVQGAVDEISDIFEPQDNEIFNEDNSPSTITEAIEEDDFSVIAQSIGDEVVLATIKVKVNRVEEAQTLTGSFGAPAIAKENAKFIVIDMDITNIGKTEFTFFPSDGFVLVDQQGREFTSYGDTIGNVKNYLNMRNLAPSITENGVIVYEIPSDATNYSLTVIKGGTSEIYKINLK
jgi:hypothetical protein